MFVAIPAMSVMTPTVLAQLPQSLLGTEGRTQFGPCYGLTGSRKRKRPEIAAAIDGETLNIYDVRDKCANLMWTLTTKRYKNRSLSHPMLFHQRVYSHAHHVP